MAHLYWICQDTYGGSPAERALCLEVGMATKLDETARARPASIADAVSAKNIADDLADVQRQHNPKRCPCRSRAGRAYDAVGKTLRELEATYPQQLEGVHVLWKAMSGGTHSMFMPRIEQTVAPGVKALGGPATYAQRVQLADYLLLCFGNIGAWVLQVLGIEDGRAIQTAGETLRRMQAYTRAVGGTLDHMR